MDVGAPEPMSASTLNISRWHHGETGLQHCRFGLLVNLRLAGSEES